MYTVNRLTCLMLLVIPSSKPILYQYRIPYAVLTTTEVSTTPEASTTPVLMRTTQLLNTTTFVSSTKVTKSASPPTTASDWDGCSEEEAPANIGPYEVPSQRDLILLTTQLLLRMFDKYHEKQLYFLKDIKEATKATSEFEKNCMSARRRQAYRRCVKKVGGYCEMLTKRLVTKLERQRTEFIADMKSGVCDMAAMRTDPVALMNSLAVEQVSLEFALPGFLRLLNSCSATCHKDAFLTTIMERMGHGALAMSNQDRLVQNILKNSFYNTYKRGV